MLVFGSAGASPSLLINPTHIHALGMAAGIQAKNPIDGDTDPTSYFSHSQQAPSLIKRHTPHVSHCMALCLFATQSLGSTARASIEHAFRAASFADSRPVEVWRVINIAFLTIVHNQIPSR